MYKGVFMIKKNQGKRTQFHKKYRVFDGLGSVYFDTLEECRSYVNIRSKALKNMFERSKQIYLSINEYYIKSLVKFRISEKLNREISNMLCDVLDNFRYMTKQIFMEYMLSKLKFIYLTYLRISKALDMKLLTRNIEMSINAFFVEYPVYRGAKVDKNLKIETNTAILKMA